MSKDTLVLVLKLGEAFAKHLFVILKPSWQLTAQKASFRDLFGTLKMDNKHESSNLYTNQLDICWIMSLSMPFSRIRALDLAVAGTHREGNRAVHACLPPRLCSSELAG